MKTRFIKSLLGFALIAITPSLLNAQVAINQTGNPPAECSILDISSDTRGLLIPRIALSGISDATPIEGEILDGLIVYNTSNTTELSPGLYAWFDGSWGRVNVSNQTFTHGVPANSHEVTTPLNYFDAYAYCSNLSNEGFTDWRLPTLTEAEILDNDGEFGSLNEFVWTTTASGEGTGSGRKNMLYKPSNDERKLLEISELHSFRCVR